MTPKLFSNYCCDEIGQANNPSVIRITEICSLDWVIEGSGWRNLISIINYQDALSTFVLFKVYNRLDDRDEGEVN